MKLTVSYASSLPDLSGQWDSPLWRTVRPITIGCFLRESSAHRPITRVKVLHDDVSVRVMFSVHDRYVCCTRTEYGSDVWKDSCVEWFVQPGADTGYFNFEVNCCGTLLVSYNRIMVRDKARVKYSAPVLPDTGKQIKVFHSLSCPLKKEIIEPVRWIVELGVPLSFFEVFAGPLGKLQGSLWRANFNKCADESSQPHWATWSPVSEKNFHRPEDFGEMTFAGR